MKGLVSKLDSGVKSIFGYVGIIMILIETYAVFARNVLKAPAPWTDETLKCCLYGLYLFVPVWLL